MSTNERSRMRPQDLPSEGEDQQRGARHVENYIGLALDPLQQRAINEFLAAHPHLDEEDAISILLDLGLRAADGERMVFDPPQETATPTQAAHDG